jgi:hypothetical protein
MYRGGELVGVAVYSYPVNESVFKPFGGTARDSIELGRFVLLPDVPGNGESCFLGRTFAALRKLELRGVVSFSDPIARRSASGVTVFPGHIGTIYQAHNGTYLGRATPRTLRLWPDGRVVSSRRMQKIRSGEKGALPAIEEFRSYGADEPWDDRSAWMNHWLGKLTRRLPHPGNHKYGWALDRRIQLGISLPYPKAMSDAKSHNF